MGEPREGLKSPSRFSFVTRLPVLDLLIHMLNLNVKALTTASKNL